MYYICTEVQLTVCEKNENTNCLTRKTCRFVFALHQFYALVLLRWFARLPEIPPDTSETNPIMCVEEHPQFSKITPDMVVTGCAKRSIEFDVQLGKHVETLKGEPCVCIILSTVYSSAERYVSQESRTKGHQKIGPPGCFFNIHNVTKIVNPFLMTSMQEHCLILCLGDGDLSNIKSTTIVQHLLIETCSTEYIVWRLELYFWKDVHFIRKKNSNQLGCLLSGALLSVHR